MNSLKSVFMEGTETFTIKLKLNPTVANHSMFRLAMLKGML